MKTQRYGIADGTRSVSHLTSHNHHDALGIMLKGLWSLISTGTLKRSALRSYKLNRTNGEIADAPARSFPEDGSYEGEYGMGRVVRYVEGPSDKRWMEERDRNYVFRLEREGRLSTVEPNLRTEIPSLYVEVIAARATARLSPAPAIVSPPPLASAVVAAVATDAPPDPDYFAFSHQ